VKIFAFNFCFHSVFNLYRYTAGGDAGGVASALATAREAGFTVNHTVDALLSRADIGEQEYFEQGNHIALLVNPTAIAVGLYKLHPVDP
jgi:hypothetical protein